MRQQAYTTWETMLNESLVRASVVRYMAAREGAEAARAQTESERARWFLWTRDLAGLLESYEKSRETYRSFEAFMPRIVDFFTTVSERSSSLTEEFERSRPYVVDMSPANGTLNVDPATSEVSFRFSTKMGKGVNVNYGPGGEDTYPKVTTFGWDEAGTVLTLKVVLEPGRKYEFVLNSEFGGAMQTPSGVPARMYKASFSTRAASQ